jgi:fructokinase
VAGVGLAGTPAVLGATSRAEAVIGADGAASYTFAMEWSLPAGLDLDDDAVRVVHVTSQAPLLAPGAADTLALVERAARRGRDDLLRHQPAARDHRDGRRRGRGRAPDGGARPCGSRPPTRTSSRCGPSASSVRAPPPCSPCRWPGRGGRHPRRRGCLVARLLRSGLVHRRRARAAGRRGRHHRCRRHLRGRAARPPLAGARTRGRDQICALEPEGWTAALSYAARAAAVTVGGWVRTRRPGRSWTWSPP